MEEQRLSMTWRSFEIVLFVLTRDTLTGKSTKAVATAEGQNISEQARETLTYGILILKHNKEEVSMIRIKKAREASKNNAKEINKSHNKSSDRRNFA